jgi:hypothetical protein
VERLVAIACADGLTADPLEQGRDQVPEGGIVVDDEDLAAVGDHVCTPKLPKSFRLAPQAVNDRS